VRKTLVVLGCLALGLVFVTDPRGLSQPAGKADAGPDEQAIRQAVAAYAEAFNKGDVAAIAAFWADDAEYTDEAGTTTKGRDAITALFKQAMTDLKGSKMALKVSGVRLVKGVVALVDGTSAVTAPDGTVDEGRFSAVWFKDGDKWLLRSARDLPGEVTDATPGAGLKELQWMVGEWEAEKGVVRATVRKALGGAFLLQEYTLKEGDGELHVNQLIGFDPLTGQIKSWTFDSRGGYGEGLWQRNGNAWTIETAGVLPNGATGSAKNVIRFVDDQTLLFQGRDREIDGQPIPDSEVKLTRKAAAK
jgi:uncharacterized protein (TIGR02246 family)